MDYNRTPDMGMSIYMNGCSCGHLWDEISSMRNNCSDCKVGVMRIGMTYTPMQPWEEPYGLEKGLRAGTIFPCLHLPFVGGGCK